MKNTHTPVRTMVAAALALVAAALGAPAAVGLAEACTTFLVEGEGETLVGKNYDWNQGEALLVVNPRGARKQALHLSPGDRPAEWTSRHASLTFNQYGREFPNGGMNERGLVVEIMWLDTSVYPPPDQRPVVNQLQWIQYQLDNYASVAEMIAHAQDLRVALVHARVHYLACDRGGQCAAFEHLDGQMRVSRARPQARALTNSTYAESLAFLARQGSGLPAGNGSLERFVRAARLASRPGQRGGRSLRDRAFSVLENVAQGQYTKWNIVYDPTRLQVHFRTRAAGAIKTVDFARMARDCHTPAQILDIDVTGAGDVTRQFVPYSRERNHALLQVTMAPLLRVLPSLPGGGIIEHVAAYPERMTCAASGATRGSH